MANWDSTFDNKPAGTDLVGEMDDYIRATRQETRIRMAKEHLFDMTNPTTQGHQGLARMGSARVWWSDTEPAQPTPSASEADNDGTSGRVWVVTSSGTPTGVIKVYSGSAWVDVTSAANLLALIKTVDGAGSGLDADLLDGAAQNALNVDMVDSYHANQLAKTASTSGGLKLTGARHGNTQNRGDLYGDLSGLIPNVGDKMLIVGCIMPGSSVVFTTSYAERMTSSSIRIYGNAIKTTDSGYIFIDYYDFASGSTDKVNMSVAW